MSSRRRRHRARADEEADTKSAGCVSCHTASDQQVDASDSTGGGARLHRLSRRRRQDHAAIAKLAARSRRPMWRRATSAHVLPRYPGDLALAELGESRSAATRCSTRRRPNMCASSTRPTIAWCARAAAPAIMEIIEAAERSLMSTGAMLWGGASYNNGIAPFKNYIFGEAYTSNRASRRAWSRPPTASPPTPDRTSRATRRRARVTPNLTEAETARGALAKLYPLPTWHVIPPGDIFRVFERGGRNINTQFPEIGLPNSLGPDPAAGGARPARPAPVEPRPRHRAPGGDPGTQHPQDAAQRPVHVVHGHQRPARRLSQLGLRRLPRRLRQRPRADPQPRSTPNMAATDRPRRSIRPSPTSWSRSMTTKAMAGTSRPRRTPTMTS